jgi:toxin ParE1/3/4
MKQLVFSEKSLDDLEGILRFIACDKPVAASLFVERLQAQCEALAQFPEIGTRRDDLLEDLRLFSFRGYGIYYRNLADIVRIERVLRASQNVGIQHFE